MYVFYNDKLMHISFLLQPLFWLELHLGCRWGAGDYKIEQRFLGQSLSIAIPKLSIVIFYLCEQGNVINNKQKNL